VIEMQSTLVHPYNRAFKCFQSQLGATVLSDWLSKGIGDRSPWHGAVSV